MCHSLGKYLEYLGYITLGSFRKAGKAELEMAFFMATYLFSLKLKLTNMLDWIFCASFFEPH